MLIKEVSIGLHNDYSLVSVGVNMTSRLISSKAPYRRSDTALRIFKTIGILKTDKHKLSHVTPICKVDSIGIGLPNRLPLE